MTSYLTATVVMASYSAVFISYVTVQDLKLPVATFQDLLKDGRYHLLAVIGTAQLNYFDVSAQTFVFSHITGSERPANSKEKNPSSEPISTADSVEST